MLVLAMGACKVSKDVHTPDVSLPASFRNSTSGDTSSIANIPWSSFFTDDVLVKLIDSALVYNLDMQLAIKNIEASRLLSKQAKWNNVPTLALNVTANTDRPSDNSLNGLSLAQYGLGNHIEDYSANLSISWEADIWQKIHNKNKVALASYLQTREARNLVQTSIVANVAQGYYNLLMLDAQLAIAQKNVLLNDSTLRMIRLEFDAGQVTLLAVQQATAQRLAAAELVPQFQQNIAIQENALRLLTGDLPGSIDRSTSLRDLPVPENLPAGIPSEMLARRPDVRGLELALTIANAKVGITKATMYPSLQITAAGGVNSFKTSNWFNIPASLFGIVAGSVLQPVLQHKELKTNYKVALVERDETVIRFRRSVLVAVGEVSDALVKIEKLKQQQSIVNDRVQALQGATANANLLFKSGMANYLEVITAQSNVLQSELELAAVKRSELGAVAELYQSLGGGWK